MTVNTWSSHWRVYGTAGDDTSCLAARPSTFLTQANPSTGSSSSELCTPWWPCPDRLALPWCLPPFSKCSRILACYQRVYCGRAYVIGRNAQTCAASSRASSPAPALLRLLAFDVHSWYYEWLLWSKSLHHCSKSHRLGFFSSQRSLSRASCSFLGQSWPCACLCTGWLRARPWACDWPRL